ncbi:MAG: UDP-3-O-acyl-N-acetylglucosamine deacetylase [Bauldia sp.]|nr:UDP-3-O-acyl-N-acetylglucosamine deacetylase [Bauldia sp.]
MNGRLGVLQTTLQGRVSVSGIGVHSGAPATVTIAPAPANTGILIIRSEAGARQGIAADWRSVQATDHCTMVASGGKSVATIEHLMATLRALEIDNAIVEVDGPEVPVMDGSASAFVKAIDKAGITSQPAARRFVKVLKPVRVERGHSHAELLPADTARIEVEIDFATPAIGCQTYRGDVTPARFRRELARARTFGFMADVEGLRAKGLALGASLENTVALDGDRVLNEDGLRWSDEFVRHKALDAVGDLALAGAPVLGCYRSYRGGHALNVAMLQALFADRSAYAVVEPQVRHEGSFAGAPLSAVAMAPEV